MKKKITIELEYDDVISTNSALELAIRTLATAQNCLNVQTNATALNLRRIADSIRKQTIEQV